SSRRRHTRFSRDWSSDVCSSDLTHRFTVSTSLDGALALPAGFAFAGVHAGIKRSRKDLGLIRCTSSAGASAAGVFTRNLVRAARSEERRGGKEGGSRREARQHTA